jgi:hypothetical protein
MPSGFITTADFESNVKDEWVQIYGKLNRVAYDLDPTDSGGQYDINTTEGSTCAGYEAFVQITEPDKELYCIRCCKHAENCPVDNLTSSCKDDLGIKKW